jgi:hypothetical protein
MATLFETDHEPFAEGSYRLARIGRSGGIDARGLRREKECDECGGKGYKDPSIGEEGPEECEGCCGTGSVRG